MNTHKRDSGVNPFIRPLNLNLASTEEVPDVNIPPGEKDESVSTITQLLQKDTFSGMSPIKYAQGISSNTDVENDFTLNPNSSGTSPGCSKITVSSETNTYQINNSIPLESCGPDTFLNLDQCAMTDRNGTIITNLIDPATNDINGQAGLTLMQHIIGQEEFPDPILYNDRDGVMVQTGINRKIVLKTVDVSIKKIAGGNNPYVKFYSTTRKDRSQKTVSDTQIYK
jgi:hypothetical protein